MTKLLRMFEQRQFQQRRVSIKSLSSGTVSSGEAGNRVTFDDQVSIQGSSGAFPSRSAIIQQINVSSSSDVKIGDEIHIHYNRLKEDDNNLAFVLNDKTMTVDKKIIFVMKRTWFWAMIVTLILVCFIPAIPNVLKMYIATYNELFTVLGPDAWGGRPAQSDLKALKSPISRIILSETADQSESCTTKDDCIGRLQAMQNYYMDELQLGDIPFNFLVGDDGNVYEARGFTHQGEIPRTDTANYFDDAGLFVALIGTFIEEPPSDEQVATFWKFVESSVKRGMIAENFSLLSQNQIAMRNVSNGLKVILNKDVPNFVEISPVIDRNSWINIAYPNDTHPVIMFNKSRTFSSPADVIALQAIPLISPDKLCTNLDDCSDYLKEILTASLDNGFYDIAFNFVIGNFGVFECRGWSARPDVFLVPSFTDYEIIKQNFINIAVIASDFDDYFNQTAFDVLKNGALMGKVAKYIGFKCDDNLKAFCPNETVNVYA